MKNNTRASGELAGIFIIVFIIVIIIGFLMWLIPTYSVWSSEKSGEAMKMKATQERQVLIEQARAEMESAQLRADAIEIIGEMAKKYPEYREQEFIGAFGEALKN